MAITRLSDTHLVILSHASRQSEGRLLPLPETAGKGRGAKTRTLKSLLRRKLIEEVPATAGDTEWRRDEDDVPLTLKITDAGLAAIGIEPKADQPAGEDRPQDASIPAEDGSKVFRKETKGAAIVRLLGRKSGASIADLMDASGWQAHSVRGFLSGTLKKKHGLIVESEKAEGGIRRYRIPA